MAVLRDNHQRARMMFTMGVVIAREGTNGLHTNVPTISSFAEKVPTMLAHFGSLPQLADVPFFDRIDASEMDAQATLNAVRLAVLERARRRTPC